MQPKTARALVAAAFGGVSGLAAGWLGASLGAGVLAPAVAALQAAKAAGHPGDLAVVPPIWRAWSARPWAARLALPLAHPHWLLLPAALALALGGALAWAAWKAPQGAKWGGPPAAGRGQFGTAHWRPAATLPQTFARWRAGETTVAGVLVGADPGPKPTGGWVLARDEHVLVLGSTRSGKSRRVILPIIGILGAQGIKGESLVIADPKGELHGHAAAWLTDQGYTVRRVDLIRPRPGGTARFNPVAAVHRALHADPPDPAEAARVARQVAHLVVWGQPGSLVSTDPLWINGQIALITALILAVAERAKAPDQAHLAAAFRLLLLAGEGNALDVEMQTLPRDYPARLAYGTFKLAQDKTRSSIATTAAVTLQLWADPEIAWLTADQDHDLPGLGAGDRPTATFLVVPHNDASRWVAAGLYVSQVFRALTQAAREVGGRLPRRVTFLLDEFGNLPPMPDFDTFVTVAAGMGIRLVLALQNIEQLRKHYEWVERTIRGNLGTWLFLRTSDVQTTRELVEMAGRYTTQSESAQYPRVGWTTVTTAVGHTSQGESLTGRELITVDEILRWPQDAALVLQAGYPPAELPLPDLSAWSAFAPLHDRARWTWPEAAVPAVDTQAGAEQDWLPEGDAPPPGANRVQKDRLCQGGG